MGTIKRITGPVVIAEDLEEAKMYDVVKVGNEKLIGEIIKLNKGLATIQVYEDTTGLRPGEPVTNTGQSLSVELGPGLLQSIYDGIQRPLELIKQASGTFIKRGIQADAIDKKKKWKFHAVAKNGAEVSTGDLLGTVQETELILHKVLVPPGVKGKVTSINSGEFTVEEIVCTIEGKKKHKISMLQRWPVRTPRPYVEKLTPEVPLVTGQRILDTFFPISKGGTAAIPGPFGSGKCVYGKTPVMLADGSLKPIEEIYKDSLTEGSLETVGHEEYIYLKKPLEVFSLYNDKIQKTSTQMVYKTKTDKLIQIKTRSGRKLKITPIHKLFKLCSDANIKEIEAANLKLGDFLIAPRKLKILNNQNQNLKTFWPQGLRKENNLLRLRRASTPVNLPEYMTSDLATWLGLFIAEGYIRANRTIVFTNSETQLLELFRSLTKKIFSIDCKLEKQPEKTPSLLVGSKIIVDFIDALGTGRTSHYKQIPTTVLNSSEEVLKSFLLGYYLGDGSFYTGTVELGTASNKLATGLSYLLARFGILSSTRERQLDTTHYRVCIDGLQNLKLFSELFNYNHIKLQKIFSYIQSKSYGWSAKDVVPIQPELLRNIYELAGKPYAQLMQAGLEIHNYIGNKECISTEKFKQFVKTAYAPSEVYSRLQKISSLLEWVFADEIIEVKLLDGPFNVYDLSLPGIENFIGGNMPAILHNTVTQQALAKWSDAQIVVYIGCGERGNEMTEVLSEFPELIDPRTKKPLMQRTILIANTSNMPVAAREASVYTGITIAEFYRDMGYDVALMADSTSRWAEAMREISGRIEEMPSEEGYPPYLGRKLAEFYERAGRITCYGNEKAKGSVTIIGAVSPPGGDISEPVSQNTLRVTKVFWALDAKLAQRRHFPAINWLKSYSLYLDIIENTCVNTISSDWGKLRGDAMTLLQKESELQQIVQLVGPDALPEKEQVILDAARMIREDFLQQSAYHEVDAFATLKKQHRMLKVIMRFYERAVSALDLGAQLKQVVELPIRYEIARMKEVPEEQLDKKYESIYSGIDMQFDNLINSLSKVSEEEKGRNAESSAQAN